MDDDALFGMPSDRGKVCALLFERRTFNPKALPPAFVSDAEKARIAFGNESGRPYAVPIRVTDLLATWPGYGHEQLERALLLLSKLAPQAGRYFQCDRLPAGPAVWFAEDDAQAVWIQRALADDRKWIDTRSRFPAQEAQITPNGWERVAELTRRNARTNPVFVAMWFGRPDKVPQMTDRYEKAVYPAIWSAGYNAHRSDRDEHNEGIMDKIRFDIQRAPFVVADFTGHNRGVYYEAGLASGRGIEVVHCCPDDEFDEKHFDIAHRNLIKYSDDNDLLVRLNRRILGSIGEGPFFRERGSKTM